MKKLILVKPNASIPADKNPDKNCLKKGKTRSEKKENIQIEKKKIEKKRLSKPQPLGLMLNY